MTNDESLEVYQNGSLASSPTVKMLIAAVKRNIFLIIFFTTFATMFALVFAVANVKTVYTVKESVIFITDIQGNTTINTNVSLAKRHLDNVSQMIVSDKFVASANEIYKGEGSISSKNIVVNSNNDSLIFEISYSDYSEDVAKQKLIAVVESAGASLQEYFVGAEVDLRAVQREPITSTSNATTKYVVIGFTVGLFVSIGIAVMLTAFTNTIYTEEDLEQITNASLLGILDDTDIKKKKRKHKSKS